jgi:hypothetical protein
MSTSPTTTPPSLTIKDFRLTFVWVETILDPISGAVQLDAPFNFLQKSNVYQHVFAKVLVGVSGLNLQVPWRTHKEQFFWKYYLSGADLEAVGARQAWEHLVPLLTKLPFSVKNWKQGNITIEGFYYPHGLALAVTFRVVGSFTLDQVVTLAYAIKDGDEKIPAEGPKGPVVCTLDSLARDAFKYMRESLGKGINAGKRRDAFSIFTVVKAQPGTLFVSDGPVHQAIQAVTEWPPDWETAGLLPVQDVQVPTKGSDSRGSILFARPRSRGVWLPGLFASNRLKKPSLSCYHHNLVYGCMHVDSLGGLVEGTLGLLKDTPLANLDPTLKSCARNAIDRLDELYSGDRKQSYRSYSLKKQIENEIKDLDALRGYMNPGQKPLGAPG